MGGPRIDKEEVRKTILAQPRTFEYTDIAREAKISTASASHIIRDMIAEGFIIVDHKIGKRKIYAVSSNGGNNGVEKPNILQLPPHERFEYIGDIVDMVVNGITPSALITGVAGIGKTYIVKDRLHANGFKENDHYVINTTHATPGGLYCLLHKHRDQTVVFDDCDSVFSDEKSVNILKAALDSYEVRKLCWPTMGKLPEGIEDSFEFTGNIIFVSNRTSDRIDEAVKSRTMVIDLQMSRKEIGEYIGTIMENITIVKLPMEDKQIVLDELIQVADSFDQFNIRTFIKACRLYKGAMLSGKDWKKSLAIIR